jgi:prepilin-type N-terminal cleavage/methylation domain-containing protein
MRNNNGFSLVEMIVTAIIASIVGILFLTFMRLHNQSLNEGVARTSMQMQSELVSLQLGRTVRAADRIFAGDEAWNPNPGLATRSVNAIVAYSANGVATCSYTISSGARHFLMEQRTGVDAAPHAMRCGQDTIVIDDGSSFILSTDRKRVVLNLNFTINYRNTVYPLAAKRDMYLCRN